MKLKAFLVGDHSSYHCGSAAAFSVLKSTVSTIYDIVDDIDECDAIFVNGEGSMHHNSKNFTEKMIILRKALDEGKRASLVNTVWQDNSDLHDMTLRRLHEIVVHEPLSQNDLLQRHRISSSVHLDLSYYAPIDESAAAEDWSKQVVVSDFHSSELDLWFRVTRGPLAKRTYFDMRDFSWSSLVKSMRTCRLIVTGRHHAMYAACAARRPFIAMVGNTHKVEGLIAASPFPIPIVKTVHQASAMLKWAVDNRGMYKEFFHWMDEYPRWIVR